MTDKPTHTPLSALWRVLFGDKRTPTHAAISEWVRDYGYKCEPAEALAHAWEYEDAPGLPDVFLFRLRARPPCTGARMEGCHDHDLGDWMFGSCMPCADNQRSQLVPPTWDEVVAYVAKYERTKETIMDIKVQHTKSVTIPALSGGGAELTLKVEYAGEKVVVTFTAKTPSSGGQRDNFPAQCVNVGVGPGGIRALVTLLNEALGPSTGGPGR